MNMTHRNKRTPPFALCILCLFASVSLLFMSCDIEKSATEHVVLVGDIIVSAHTPESSAILGAAILLDGTATGKLTPDTLFDIEEGLHEITVLKLGYTESSQDVAVVATQTVTATIEMSISYGSEVGQTAIGFTLPSIDDSSLYTLSDYRGKVTLVTFYFNNCNPCIVEFPHIQNVWENPSLNDKIQFLGVNGQDLWQSASLFLLLHPELGITFPLLHDATQQVRAVDYNVTSHPTNILIDQNGVIRYRWGDITEQLLIESIQTLLAEGE